VLCTCLVLPRSDPSFSTSTSSRVSRASFPEGSGRVSGTSYARFCVRMRATCARLRGSTRTNGDVSRATGVDTRTTCDRYTPADAPFLEGERGGRRYRDGSRCTPFPFQTSRGDPRDVQRKGAVTPRLPEGRPPGSHHRKLSGSIGRCFGSNPMVPRDRSGRCPRPNRHRSRRQQFRIEKGRNGTSEDRKARKTKAAPLHTGRSHVCLDSINLLTNS